MNKTNRCIEFQFYWYYDSTCFGQPFCPSSGVLSCALALVHYMQFWWPFATSFDDHFAGSKLSSKLHIMYHCQRMAKNSWWWAERLPKTCTVVIPIKLESNASVGFIHKEFVTMHGHTILKFFPVFLRQLRIKQHKNVGCTHHSHVTGGYHWSQCRTRLHKQCGTETGFSSHTLVFLYQYPSPIAPCWFVHLPLVPYSLHLPLVPYNLHLPLVPYNLNWQHQNS